MSNRTVSLIAGRILKITPAINVTGQVWFQSPGKQDLPGSTFSAETPLFLGPYSNDVNFNIVYNGGDITIEEMSKGGQTGKLETEGNGTNIKVITSATYQLTNDDNGKMLAFSTACTVTVPQKLRKDFSCGWSQDGAGVVTFAAASGVTIQSKGAALVSSAQYSVGGVFGWNVLNTFRLTGV